MARKFIAASEELVSKLMAISNREGKTFYSFVNDIFEEVIGIYDQRRTLQEVTEFYNLMEMQTTSGVILTPPDALKYVVEKLSPEEKEQFEKLWYAWGQWYGKYLGSKFPEHTLEAFGRFLSLSRGELSEVEVTPGDPVKLRCVSSLISLQYTKLLQNYLEGVIHSLGYETIRRECLKGLILLEFKLIKKGEKPSEEMPVEEE